MVVTILYLLAGVFLPFTSGHLDVLYKWRSMEFEFPSESVRQNLIRSKEYIPGTNSLPLDVDVWYKGTDNTIFVTFPKFQKGVPITLGTVASARKGNFHLIKPYPDWSWHSRLSCDGMTSVFRTQIDKCDRLWVIDSGTVDLSLQSRKRLCQPRLLAFHLSSKKLAVKYLFPGHLLKENSLLTNVLIDVQDTHNDCSNTFAYVSDTVGYSLLVLDVERRKSWAVESNSMYPYPPHGLFQTNNVEFNLMDGILGMAISPGSEAEKSLYYHSLASVRESWVPTSVLKNEEYFISGHNSAYKEFKTSEEARRTQSVAEAFDKNGILYFGMLDNTLNCWNHRKPFTRENVHEIAKDNVNLQFVSGLKIVMNENEEEEIWMITNKFQTIMVGHLQVNDFNYRILMGKVKDLLRNSKCLQNQSITFPNRLAQNSSNPYKKPLNSGYGG